MTKFAEGTGTAAGKSSASGVGEAVIQRPTQFYDTEFVPYATEIGFFVAEWNDLHECLSSLFCNIVKSKSDVARAIWYAVPHDRTQRVMLLAAAQTYFERGAPALGEIETLIGAINAIGDDRDNILHSPLAVRVSEPVDVTPLWFFGHQRALKLKERIGEKRFLDAVGSYRKKARELAQFALKLNEYTINCHQDAARNNPLQPLPERPSWLNEKHKKQARGLLRSTRSK